MSKNLRDVIVAALGAPIILASACASEPEQSAARPDVFNPLPAQGACAGEVDRINRIIVSMYENNKNPNMKTAVGFAGGHDQGYNQEFMRCLQDEVSRTSGGKLTLRFEGEGQLYMIQSR